MNAINSPVIATSGASLFGLRETIRIATMDKNSATGKVKGAMQEIALQAIQDGIKFDDLIARERDFWKSMEDWPTKNTKANGKQKVGDNAARGTIPGDAFNNFSSHLRQKYMSDPETGLIIALIKKKAEPKTIEDSPKEESGELLEAARGTEELIQEAIKFLSSKGYLVVAPELAEKAAEFLLSQNESESKAA